MNNTTTHAITLYIGSACHLCSEAKDVIAPVLQELGWACSTVNITNNADLVSLYGVRIPVIKTPGGVEKGWPFTAGQVRRLLLAEE